MSREEQAIKAAEEASRNATFHILEGDLDRALDWARVTQQHLLHAMNEAVKRAGPSGTKKVKP